MSRPRPRPKSKSQTDASSDGIPAERSVASVASPEKLVQQLPSGRTRSWLSIWVGFHLFALFLSFTSVVEPSGLQSRLLQLTYPYLRSGHFAADDRPVYLAHGGPTEQPHRLQITSDAITDIEQVDRCEWRTVGSGSYSEAVPSPGLAVSDRVARWLSTSATLAENQQSGVVADLIVPIAASFEDANAIRIVRFPTDLDDVNARETSPYVARLVRTEGAIELIQLSPKRLSSQAVTLPEDAAHE